MPQRITQYRLSLVTLAALLASGLTSPAAAQTLVGVGFANAMNGSGAVDVYVDGAKVFSNVFSGDVTLFPARLEAGKRQVVVTRAGVAPGQADMFGKEMNFASSGLWTFKTDNANFLTYKMTATRNGDY